MPARQSSRREENTPGISSALFPKDADNDASPPIKRESNGSKTFVVSETRKNQTAWASRNATNSFARKRGLVHGSP
jgi:hypothetical protein